MHVYVYNADTTILYTHAHARARARVKSENFRKTLCTAGKKIYDLEYNYHGKILPRTKTYARASGVALSHTEECVFFSFPHTCVRFFQQSLTISTAAIPRLINITAEGKEH